MIIDGESKIFSTYLPNNQYYDNLLPYIPMIKYEIFDNNFDGLNDMFKFKINIPTALFINKDIINNTPPKTSIVIHISIGIKLFFIIFFSLSQSNLGFL